MKSKIKVFATLLLLCFFLSSCVYSLFPIYTKDTIVFNEGLLGKWQLGNDPDYTITFSTKSDKDNEESQLDNDDLGRILTAAKALFSVDLDSLEHLVVRGDTLKGEKAIKDYFLARMDTAQIDAINELNNDREVSEALKTVTKRAEEELANGNLFEFEQSAESYIMTLNDGGDKFIHEMYLVRIGDDIFMDIYAEESDYFDKAIESDSFLPVHTFMKLKLNENKLDLISFDLHKLNKLFKSNLIRLKHENVEGTILITAQPKELQKFLNKYSDDETVFGEAAIYTRVAQ